ncbi:MAG: hypothetical protein JXA62_00875 [Candidatus Aminicenantes bacterium]|nr:hypothetical protein [Candidatus Aminicenantes bacterium]
MKRHTLVAKGNIQLARHHYNKGYNYKNTGYRYMERVNSGLFDSEVSRLPHFNLTL